MAIVFGWFLFLSMFLGLVQSIIEPLKVIRKRRTTNHFKLKLVGWWLWDLTVASSAAWVLGYVLPGGPKMLISGTTLIVCGYASWALLIGGVITVIWGFTLNTKQSVSA
ncbi:MAG: hypothetical protein ACOH18_05235 [Candidatus Saccharimonadaceae bacterium]